MKKLTFVLVLSVLSTLVFAGGILTNTNQSAQFIRMMSRNASLDIDAVYFNPAGVIKLEDGWHFAFYSQTIFQDKNVESEFPLLNDGTYVGKVSVPVFPTAFAVYKKENWAFSLGFGPNAGGGSAEFERGLPSFEIPISKMAPGLQQLSMLSQVGMNIDLPTGYDVDLYFNGSSVFWGIQLGATCKINDILSVYGGFRYLPSKNVYQGHIRDISLTFNGQPINAMNWMNDRVGDITDKSAYYSGLAAQASTGSTQLSAAATGLQPIIDGGGGALTINQLADLGKIDANTKAVLVGTLQTLGVPDEQISGLSIATVQGTFSTASTTLAGQAAQASGAATILTGVASGLDEKASQLGDKEVDTEQKGNGFTPIVGLNISPNEDWNIAVKYEMKTKLTLKNEYAKNDNYGEMLFGDETKNDIPAILGLGVGYKGLDWLEAQLSYTMYFNKGVNWGNNTRYMVVGQEVKREIERNGYEVGLGFQFNLSEEFAVSTGGMYGDMGVAPNYQSDFSYSNPSFTVGAGIMWRITDKLTLDAGISNTFYQDQTVPFEDPDFSTYNDILGKTTLNFAAGLSYSIF